MFQYKGNVKLVNVDIEYLKALHDVCSEVYYREYNYENKPFIGILIDKNDSKYVIPLTSAKDKHKRWRNVYPDRMLVFEMENAESIGKNDIFVETSEADKVKHILAAIDIKKMIPIRDDVITEVSLNSLPEDTEEDLRYKDLLNKEYIFIIRHKEYILKRANKLYNTQQRTGKVVKYGCKFDVLEEVCTNYNKKER